MKSLANKTLTSCFLLFISLFSLSQESDNYYSTHELKDTYLFFLHREAILKDALDRNQNGIIELDLPNEHLKLSEVFLPFIGHMNEPLSINPSLRTYDDYMFKSFVFYNLFHSKINRSGKRNRHEVFPMEESLNYLEDVFQKQRMPNYLKYNESLLANFYQYDFSACDLCEANNASIFCFLCHNYDVSTLNTPADIDQKYFTNNYLNFLARAEGCAPNLQSDYADLLGLAQGHAVEIGTHSNTGISQRGIKINPGNYEVMLHASGIWESDEDCINCLVVGVQVYDKNYNLLTQDDIPGLTAPTENFPFYTNRKSLSIHDDPDLSLYFSDFYPNWDEKCVNFAINNPEAAYMDIHFFTPYIGESEFAVGHYPRIFLDDIYLGLNNGVNLIQDSEFLLDRNNSPWERMSLESDKAVYRDRTPLAESLEKATKQLNNHLNKQTNKPIDILLSFPHISEYKRTSNDSLILNPFIENEEYLDVLPEFGNKNAITYYFNQIEAEFNAWQKRNGYNKYNRPSINIAGIYLTSEDLPANNSAYYNYVKYIRKQVESRGWVLTASPFSRFSCSTPSLGFRFEEYKDLFHQLWLQPNSFSKRQPATGRQVVDRDILKLTSTKIGTENVGMMMEYNLPTNRGELIDPYHPYHRFHDYLDYSIKYNMVNSYRAFVDDEGGFYNLATSRVDSEREIYNRIYDYIKLSETGMVPNSGFENFENDELLHWKYFDGTSISHSSPAFIYPNQSGSNQTLNASAIDFSELENVITSGRISVTPGSDYELSLSSSISSSGCSFGVINQLDENFQSAEISFIQQISSNGEWVNHSQPFTSSENTRFIELILIPGCDVLLKDINIKKSDTPVYSTTFNQTPPLKISKLDTSFTTQTIPLTLISDSLKVSWSAKYSPSNGLAAQLKNYSIELRFFDNSGEEFNISNPSSSQVSSSYYYFKENYGSDYSIEDSTSNALSYSDGPWNIVTPQTAFSQEQSNHGLSFSYEIECQNQNGTFDYLLQGAPNYCAVCFPQIGINCENLNSVDLSSQSPYDGLNTWWTNQSTYNEFNFNLEEAYSQGARSIQVLFFQKNGSNGDLLTIHHPIVTVIDKVLSSSSHSFQTKEPINSNKMKSDTEGTNTSSFSVFPNPASDNIQVNFSALAHSESFLLQLHDLTGKLVYTESVHPNTHTTTINTTNWQSGSYIISLSSEKQPLTREKVLIIH